MNSQKNRHGSRVVQESIQTGSKVMIRVEGILSKLDAKFYGPFTVAERTQGGNYKSEELEELSEVESSNAEVERILNNRFRNGTKKYLVKWKDFPEEENEWLPEELFDSREIIDEYNNGIAQTINIATIKRQNFKYKEITEKELNLMGDYVMVNWYKENKREVKDFDVKDCDCVYVKSENNMMLISTNRKSSVVGQVLEGKFRYCTVNDNSPLLHLRESCHSFNNLVDEANKEFFMLDKRDHIIKGFGYMCTKTKIIVKKWKNFCKQPRKIREEVEILVSKEECLVMVLSKKGENHELICENDLCKLIMEPEEKYEYSSDYVSSTFHCYMYKRMIFERIYHKKCYLNITKTTEGILLSESEQAKDLQISIKANLNEKEHLMLADLDFKSYWIFSIINKMNNERLCKINNRMTQLFEKMMNEFFIMDDIDGNELVIYNDQGELLVSKCVKINEVNIRNDNSECFYNAPVKFKYQNNSMNGFINNDGIISRKSKFEAAIQFKMIAIKEDIKLIPSETIQNIKFIHANEQIDNFDLLNEFEKFRQGNIEQENLIIDDYKQVEEIPINFQMKNIVSSLILQQPNIEDETEKEPDEELIEVPIEAPQVQLDNS
ncbi:unnamed protein product [Brachionus calyciflorus]|uniref:Chromo domain-containing protein n=1 Tax=Brachionus calyciflorus TaxID=104777 RepID=A0A814G026_9BILA|nr:unnamed protein product [Brachionus calyciflorus]